MLCHQDLLWHGYGSVRQKSVFTQQRSFISRDIDIPFIAVEQLRFRQHMQTSIRGNPHTMTSSYRHELFLNRQSPIDHAGSAAAALVSVPADVVFFARFPSNRRVSERNRRKSRILFCVVTLLVGSINYDEDRSEKILIVKYRSYSKVFSKQYKRSQRV